MRRAEKIRTVDLVAGADVRAWKNLGDDGITVILSGHKEGGLAEKGSRHLI